MDDEIITAIKVNAAERYGVQVSDIVVTEDLPGYGRHTHDSTCKPNCMIDCDDSDRIVTVRYDGYHLATYGVLDGNIAVWMD